MIDDMTSLKQAMAQMDSEDPAVAEAAKARAAQILSEAKLSFSKMAELIEQRQLLLRPKIVANIKRMDQPDMLGDAAFRDAGSALRREGQSFYQIAESIELNNRPAPRYEDPAPMTRALQSEMVIDEPVEPAWLRALAFAVRIAFFPIRHPLRFFTVALLAFVLFNALRGFVGFGQQVSGFVDIVASARQGVDKAMSSVSSLAGKRDTRPSHEAAAPPAPANPTPSPSTAAPSPLPTTASAPPATAIAPSANEAAPSSPPSAVAPATPLVEPRAPPSRSAANDRTRAARREDLTLAGLRRNSRGAGPCKGGIGGCYWGGGQY